MIIRERITVEKATVQEEERIKDTRAQAQAEREKLVAVTAAQQKNETATISFVGTAEMERQAAEFRAKQAVVDAEGDRAAADHRASAIRVLAEAEASKAAAVGLAEAQVMQAKATARQKEGETQAAVMQLTSSAEAQAIQVKATAQAEADEKIGFVAAKVNREKGLADADVVEARATADQKKGLAEAAVNEQKFTVEAKADAMKKLDGIGKDHEEFKLRLDKEKSVELAQINIQKDIAASQADVIGAALRAAKIDIVGGETMFFDQIIGSITKGKSIDRAVHNSEVLSTVKNAFFDHENGDFKANLRKFVHQFGLSSEEMKNLSVSALLLQLMNKASDAPTRSTISQLASTAAALGISDKPVKSIDLK